MIYTSNYARKGTDPNAVSISRRPPDWFKGPHLKIIAPTWDMICGVKEGRISEEEYARQYLAQLNRLELSMGWLNWLNSWPHPTYFLCYETPTDFCHRHVFAEWVKRKHGFLIQEWKNPKELEEQKQQDVVDNLLQF